MSTLQVSNLNDGTKTVATTNLTNGTTKAWVNFTGSSPFQIEDSLNTSSITDNSTGNYTKGFTSNFSSDNFASPSIIAQNTDAFVINQSRATSSVTLVNITHSGGSTDGRQACNICGDLA